jgi:hypothetical protein
MSGGLADTGHTQFTGATRGEIQMISLRAHAKAGFMHHLSIRQ